jgi:Phosphate uptake regulator
VNEHTSKQFDVEMEGIRSGVLLMGGLVETQIARAIAALKSSDVDLIDAVATDELAINQMQVDLDQQCSQIIAKRQPAAIDLRMVLTVVKVVNELERIGDEIKKIAYKAQQMQRPERLSNVRSTRSPAPPSLPRTTFSSRLTPLPVSTSKPPRRSSATTRRSTPRSWRFCAS